MKTIIINILFLFLFSACQVKTADPSNVVATNKFTTSISATSNIPADGTSASIITITVKKNGAPWSGSVPTFSASGINNSLGACLSSDANGISICTLKSTKAEVKTLSVQTPAVSSTSTSVTFTSNVPSASTSTISGTSTVLANGVASSFITITLKTAANVAVAGITPTFTASGSNNVIGSCSVSNAFGVSTCSLKSTKAESKSIAIATPVSVMAASPVVFVPGPVSALTSTITGTTPVVADGIAASTISISLLDASGNGISGQTPTFGATDSGGNNVYGTCSPSSAAGLSTCTLKSTTAENKNLAIITPVAKIGDVVTFISGVAVAANSTITGTGPVVADGVATSEVSIILKDAGNNPVIGQIPTFVATDTGSGNIYGSCSATDVTGTATCTLASTTAELKTLSIVTPVSKVDGTVQFGPTGASVANSTITGTSNILADGVATSTVTITLKDSLNNPVVNQIPTFTATDSGTNNVYGACSATNASGISTCTLKSTKAESKIPSILTPVIKTGTAILFTAGPAAAANSTITGTGPVNPDGISTSTITITLKDQFMNLVSGVVPTFSATGTNNTYGVCSSTNTSGVSTCTLASSIGETKTLSIDTPVVKADGTVVFQSGAPVAANSSISGTSPVLADGVDTSTVTITLKDSANAPVVGIVPVFSATGTGNSPGSCSATNTDGVSTCTLSSTKAESKNLEISSPIVKSATTPVVFTPGAPSEVTSTIVASTPTLADGVEACGITITLKDANGNAVSGQTPTFSMSGSNNTLSSCTPSDSAGESTCTVTSTTAEEKTVALLTPVAVTGNAVDFNPQGIDIQVPIELVDRGLASSKTAITFSRTRTTFDTNDYVSEINTYMFELVADNTNTSTSYTIYLVDNAGVLIADSAIVIPPSTSMKRFNVIFTPNDGASDYRVKVPGTTSAGQVKVHSAKIIVDQKKAVATKIYLPLTSGDITGENATDTNSANANVTGLTSTSFTANTYMNLYTRTDSVYDAIASGTPWTLETIISTSNAAGTATAALFDKGNNLQITPATVTQSGATTLALKSVSFASDATNFNDGDTLELRIKSSSTSYTTRIYKAGLWLKLKYLRSAEIFYRLAGRRSSNSSATSADERFYWDSGAWSNPTVYFQVNASPASSSVSLLTNAMDTGTTGTTVAGSTLTPASTYGIKRSSALSLTNLNRYFVQHTRTSGSAVLGGGFLVIKAQE